MKSPGLPVAKPSLSIHYGWIIAVAGALVNFSCLGLARYAFTMLLPGMQAGLNLKYERMGLIGTANFSGYLLAVLLAPMLIRRFRPRGTITFGLVLIGVCMLAISRSHSFLTIAPLYTLVGMGGGFANIPLLALITYWFRSKHRGKAIGVVIAGNGAAIIFAGFFIPLLNRSLGADGWRTGWLAFGLITLVTAVCACLLLRNHPRELGLEPVGQAVEISTDQLIPREQKGDGIILLRLGFLYLVFGATFMVFGTFIVTTMVSDFGLSEQQAGLYWSWVGFFSVFSGFAFGALSDRIGRKSCLMLVFMIQTITYLLVGLKLGTAGLIVSVILYGSTVFAIPAVMTAGIGDYLGLSRAATALSTITLFFAFGQTIGPAVAGLIAGATGSFLAAYLLAALLTATAALSTVFLPPPPSHHQ